MTKTKTKERELRPYDPRKIKRLRRSYDQALALVEKRAGELYAGIQDEYEAAEPSYRQLGRDARLTFGRIGQIIRGEG